LRVLFADPDAEVRSAAYKAFALAVTPTISDIRIVFARLRKGGEQEGVREALMTLCRKIADREAAVELFATEIKTANINTSRLYLDCLFQLGGEKAAAAIAAVAVKTDDALTDVATQLLGQWITPEVAPYLIEIAEKHPSERYRSRTLRGYLRVVRQMGLPVEQKVQMAAKALAVARTDADKAQAGEVLERFRAMIKGTPIFDGKTFDGWEVLGDPAWFRIEDSALVGGSHEGGNPPNGFISTKKEYGDFTLRIECKTIGQGANGGVQFRSARAPAGGGMIGYQADLTDTTQYLCFVQWGGM